MAKSDVKVTDDGEIIIDETPAAVPAVVKSTPVPITREELQAMILAAREQSNEDPEEIEKRIIDDMLTATSLEELMAPSEVVSWRNHLDERVLVRSVRFNQSDYGGGDELYAIVSGELAGKNVTLSCGARSPMLQLMIAQRQEWLPAAFKLQQSPRATKDGFYPLNLALWTSDDEPF